MHASDYQPKCPSWCVTPTHRDVLLGEQQQVEELFSLEIPPSRVQLTLIVKRVHHLQLRAGLRGEGGGTLIYCAEIALS